MALFKALTKIAFSPVRGLTEIVDDVSGKNGDNSGILTILTAGTSSVVKGTIKGIKDGVDEIYDEK